MPLRWSLWKLQIRRRAVYRLECFSRGQEARFITIRMSCVCVYMGTIINIPGEIFFRCGGMRALLYIYYMKRTYKYN